MAEVNPNPNLNPNPVIDPEELFLRLITARTVYITTDNKIATEKPNNVKATIAVVDSEILPGDDIEDAGIEVFQAIVRKVKREKKEANYAILAYHIEGYKGDTEEVIGSASIPILVVQTADWMALVPVIGQHEYYKLLEAIT